MGSPTFGFPSSNNNAPLPPFTQNNPTGGGGLFNFGGGSPYGGLPSYSLFGNPSGSVSPMANMPVFSGTSGGMAGLNSGFGFWGNSGLENNLYNSLGSAFGKGAGALIGHDLTAGLFNPTVASAFLNAMQPGIAQGQGNILNSFGAEGSRFGSAAALGLSNFNSQANLNEQSTLAGLFNNAQQEQLGLLENVMPTLHAEQANKGGLLNDILGGLMAVGGVVAAPFTGGLSLGLTSAGIGDILAGNGGGGGGQGGSPYGGIPIPMGTPGIPWSTPPFAPSSSPSANQNFWDSYQINNLSGSAASSMFDSNNGWDDLNTFLSTPGGSA